MNLNSDLQTIRTENMTLKQKLLNTQITRESFEGNDKNVLYMTGLPNYVTLIRLFDIIQPHLPEGFMSSLSTFHKFFLVLMKLRLSTPVQDLAYPFGVSKSTVSRTFISPIHVMYERLKSLQTHLYFHSCVSRKELNEPHDEVQRLRQKVRKIHKACTQSTIARNKFQNKLAGTCNVKLPINADHE